MKNFKNFRAILKNKAFAKKQSKILAVCALLIILGIVATYHETRITSGSLNLKTFWTLVGEDKVDYVVINDQSAILNVYLKAEDPRQQTKVETIINPSNKEFTEELTNLNIDVKYQPARIRDTLPKLLLWVPFIIMLFVMMSHATKASSETPLRGKRETDLDTEAASNGTNKICNTVLFSDIAGLTEEKEELRYAIDSIKNIDRLKLLGVRPVKGILLEGPPGVGKTLLAKAVAGEASINFLSYSGSDFVEMYVGVGAKRVREMYAEAIKNRPCVVFIDEVDALGSQRTNSPSGGALESNQTLVSLLEKMDGINSESGIMFMAATNRVSLLDSALLRPGRFDKVIHVGPPKSKEDREAIVAIHLKNKSVAQDVTVKAVAKLCFGLTGAEIEGVLNDAVFESFKTQGDGTITIEHIDKSVMKMFAKGLAKGKHSSTELYRVAVHEVGHALMNRYLGRTVIKVSIQPFSSGIGGVTIVDQETLGSLSIRSKDEFLGDLMVLYSGMVAEEIILGQTSNGSSNDLEKATALIKEFVGSYGMSDGLILSLNSLNDNPLITSNIDFLSRMQQIANDVYQETKSILGKDEIQADLKRLVDVLVDKEVIYELN